MQFGVVSLRQLREIGLAEGAVEARVRAGRLHRVHRGVYSVGHRLLAGQGRWMAAVLACVSGSALSHRSSAALWELTPDQRSVVDVIAPVHGGRSRPGIYVHRSSRLCPADITSHRGIPCTTVARTLLDLASCVPRRRLERAVEQAEVLGLFDLAATEAVLARNQGVPGLRALRVVLAAPAGETVTRSELEERFLALCGRFAIPRPRVNAWIALEGDGVEVDFLWPEHHLVVETDGHATHRTRQAFERDHRRDQRLALAGYLVLRLTWRQLTFEPVAIARTVQASLRR
jgi:hypothetical protein